MFQKLVPVLKFLRILESNSQRISLSNVAVWIVLIKLLLCTNPGIAEIGGLLITLLSYQTKKLINHRVAVKETSEVEAQMSELKTKIAEQESKVSALSLQAGFKGTR